MGSTHCIRHDSNDCVKTEWIVVNIVIGVGSGAHQRSLGREEAVGFRVGAMPPGVGRVAHRLFGHLALVHVTR